MEEKHNCIAFRKFPKKLKTCRWFLYSLDRVYGFEDISPSLLDFLGASLKSVIEINRKKTFCLNEISSLLPLFYYLTEDSAQEVKSLSNRILAYSDKSHPAVFEIEERINKIVEIWQAKVTKLGGKPKGLWLVDFDNGSDFFCWKYPETEIKHRHGYQDGFSGRTIIE